jgi:hypothetical protein
LKRKFSFSHFRENAKIFSFLQNITLFGQSLVVFGRKNKKKHYQSLTYETVKCTWYCPFHFTLLFLASYKLGLWDKQNNEFTVFPVFNTETKWHLLYTDSLNIFFHYNRDSQCFWSAFTLCGSGSSLFSECQSGSVFWIWIRICLPNKDLDPHSKYRSGSRRQSNAIPMLEQSIPKGLKCLYCSDNILGYRQISWLCREN